jgi:hypothetical protein
MSRFFASKLRSAQAFGRKFTGAVQRMGNKYSQAAQVVSQGIRNNVSSSGVVGHVANTIEHSGHVAHSLANAANALDRNQKEEALRHLGFY